MLSKLINKGYEAQFCEICGVEFNLFKFQRIHKCKRCSRHICAKCGDQKHKVLDEQGLWTLEPHRVCTKCKKQLNEIVEMIDENNMQWCKNCKLAKQWVKNIAKDYEYEHFLKLFYQREENFKQDVEIIDKDVIKGRTDYTVFNYSMKQFFYIIQQGEERTQIRKNIANVLYAIAARFDQIGYVQGMSSIAAFLLCFSDEKTAYSIFCYLIEVFYPKNFFVKGNYGVTLLGLLAETHFLKEFFIHHLVNIKGPLIFHNRDPYDEQQIERLKIIVQLMTSKAFLSLFVSFFGFRHVNFVWKQIFRQNSFEVAEKAFIATLYLNRNTILQKRSYKDVQEVFQAMDTEEFIEAYYDVEIDKKFRDQALDQYYEGLSKKWTDNSQRNMRSLESTTNLTRDEIKLLQKGFCRQNQQIIITKDEFVEFVKNYYIILKESYTEDQPILEITSFFVSKIFDQYNVNAKKGLDFRQFVCCFSVCTKSRLKDRMYAIISTFKDKNKKISYESFQKLIGSLCVIAPVQMSEKKQLFMGRMKKYFQNQTEISISQLYILLNDDFINDLTVHIKSDAPEIVNRTLEKFNSK